MDELLSQDEINALLTGDSLPDSEDLSMEDSQVLGEVAGIFSNAEGNVLGMLAGKDVSTRAVETGPLTQAEFKEKLSEVPFVFRAAFGGFNSVPMALVVDRRGAMTLADLMMGGEGKELPDEVSELYLNAAHEGLSQVVGSAFTNMTGLMGGKRLMPENAASVMEEEADWKPFASLEDESKVWVSATEVSIEGLDPFTVRTLIPFDSAKAIAAAIHAAMGNAAPKAAPAPAAPPPHGAPQAQAAPHGPAAGNNPPRGAQQPAPLVDVRPAEFTPLVSKGAHGAPSNIDLIADIPVRVTVELGKTRKNISDILGMSTGSIIELDKMAGEPVDVLVNGKLVARGEVVVIDENFGVRVTEVLNTASKAYSI
ncbi:MAG: flagellar motor switch phosphatase FliY [Synergistaceae bacterium]|jgi:flagellar motor switch protein FliN/FliY|nr:flagellar motor switch phosphatase FliY [Synergistaceae bacterium]